MTKISNFFHTNSNQKTNNHYLLENEELIKNYIFRQILVFLSTPEGERAVKYTLDSIKNKEGYKYFGSIYSGGSVICELKKEKLYILANNISNVTKQNVSDIQLIIKFNFNTQKENQIKNYSYFSLNSLSLRNIGFKNLQYNVSVQTKVFFANREILINFSITPQGTSMFHIPQEASNIQDVLESIVNYMIYLSKPTRDKNGYKV